MDQTDVKQGKEIIDHFLGTVQEGSDHTINVVRKLVGDKEKVFFSMQKTKLPDSPPLPPVRKESPRRAHEFHEVEGFIEYLTKHKTKSTIVLADIATNRIEAILDENAPNGFEAIQFTPTIHPLFEPWTGIINCSNEVTDFAVFLMQNKRAVLFPDAKDLTLLFSQIRASQKITMFKGVGQGSINGLTCELNILGKDETQIVELPEIITLQVPLYVGCPEVEVEIDIMIKAQNTDLFVIGSSSQLDCLKMKAFEGMLDKIDAIDNIIVGFGGRRAVDWEYLG